MADLKAFIRQVADGGQLSRDQAEAAFEVMMSGEATPAQIGGFLMLLRARGESIDDIAGAVSVMRSRMLRVSAPPDAIDIVGTGGDASGSYNISTCTAFVVAGCNVPIAKHGNRALSSRSGAADCLMALGVNLELSPAQIGTCIDEAGIGFMFASAHHSAMRHVGPARVELGTRTIFNLLGPLSNPAGVKRQMVGVFAEHWVEPLAHVLKELGSTHVTIAHGSDGLDEITTTGPSRLAVLRDGAVTMQTIHPDDVGIPVAKPEDLKGGDPEENALALKSVLDDAASPYRDTVVLNAACALMVADKAKDWASGVDLAAHSISSGAAAERLARLVKVSNGV